MGTYIPLQYLQLQTYSAVRAKKGGGRWGLVQSEGQKTGGEVVHFGGQGIGKP